MLKEKIIENTGGKYMVREDGLIFRLYKNGREPKQIKCHINKKGYSTLHMSYDDQNKQMVYLHRLIAETFIPNPSNLATVDHIDENTGNNHVSNLRWCSLKDNLGFYHSNTAKDSRIKKAKTILAKAKNIRDEAKDLEKEIRVSVENLISIEKRIVKELEALDKNAISKRSYQGYKDITGDTYNNIEELINSVGKLTKVNGVEFPSAGAAAKFIHEQSGRSNPKDISRRIRSFLSNPKQLVCTFYGKYKIT